MADLKERIAISLWHRFAPESHMEWSEEQHQAEYLDAAEGVLILGKSTFHDAQTVGWQSVETAPHGIDVLLGYLNDYSREWVCEVGQASHGWTRNGISTMSRHGQATHWQPLPLPPGASQPPAAPVEAIANLGVAEVAEAWTVLESHGFPPEAVGWPQENIGGKLPGAIDSAITALVEAREDLQAEVIKLRPPQSCSAESREAPLVTAAKALIEQYEFGAGHCLGVMSDGKACFKGSFLAKLEAVKYALALSRPESKTGKVCGYHDGCPPDGPVCHLCAHLQPGSAE